MIRESEDSFRLAFEQSGIGMAIVDTDGKWLKVNPVFCEMVGYTEQEMLEIDFQTITHNDDLDADLEYVKQMLEGTIRTYQLEKRYIRKDGEIIWISLSVSLVRDANDTPLYFISQIENITDRKKSEIALERAEAEMRSYYNANPDLITVVDTNYRIVNYNKAVEEHFGKDLKGKVCHEVYQGRHEFCPDCAVKKTIETNKPAFTFQPATPVSDDVEIYTYPIFNEDGKLVAVAEHGKVITEKLQMQAALRESEERHRALFEGSPEAIFLADPESGEIIDANPAASKLLKKPLNEIIGLHQSKLHPPRMNDFSREKFKEHAMEKVIHRLTENLVLQSDGNEVPVEILAENIKIKGKWVLQGVFRDITERKLTEEALKKSEKKYRQLVELAQEGIWVIDKDSYTTFVNPGMAKMLGYTEDEMIGRHLFSFMDEKGVEICKINLERRQKGIIEQHDFEFLRKDGSRIFTTIETAPITDDSGTYMGAIAGVLDITERKQAENERKKLHFDLNERYKELNLLYEVAKIAAKSNVTIEDVVQQIIPLIPPAWQYPKVTCARITLNGQEYSTKNFTETRWKQSASIRISGENAGLVEVYYLKEMPEIDEGPFLKEERNLINTMAKHLGTIVERKRAEEALQESERSLKKAQEIARMGNWEYDIETDKYKGSDGIYKIYDFDPAIEVTHEIVRERIHPDDLDNYDKYVMSCIETGRGEIDECRIVLSDGSTRNIHSNSNVEFDNNGKAVKRYGIVLDITERKQAEKALYESHEMFSTIMDSLDTIVYVADMDTHEIIFLNQHAKDVFGDIVGKTCWKTIQVGQSGPCDFCTNKKLVDADGVPTGTYVWEHFNETVKRWYSIRDRAIQWMDGRIVRLEIAVDITKQKENELDRTRLSRIIESSLNEIYVFDAKTLHFINVNTGALKNLGYTLDEIKLKTAFDIKPEFNESSFKELIAPLIEHEKSTIEFQTVHRRADGSIYPIEVHLQLIEDIDEPVFLAIIIDITERKQTEEALQEGEERYRSLFESSMIGIGLSQHNRVISANKALLDIFGYESLEEFSRIPIMDHVAPESKHMINDFKKNRELVTSPQKVEYRIIRKGGEIRDIEAIFNFIKISGEKYSLGTFIDITKRKHDEIEILNKNRNLSVLYSTASIAAEYSKIDDILSNVLTYILDYLESEAGGIYLIDERLDEIVLHAHKGLSDEFLETIKQVPLNDPTVAAAMSYNDVFIKESYKSEEITTLEKDHNIEKVVTLKLMSREKIIGFANIVIPSEREISKEDIPVLESIGKHVGIVIDNLRLLNETQTANEELKSLNKIKDELLSNVSHELKTPITSIKGYSELIVDEKLGKINEQQKNAMEVVVRNSERLNRLIDSLIYLTLVRVGKVKYKFGQIRIDNIIDSVVCDISQLVEKKGLTIEKKIPTSLASINGDEDKIIEVLINLIDNAIKFTPIGGKITVEADAEGDNLHIRVSDTGIGIPPEHIANMFQEFYQIDASSTRNYGGAGLGLYISKTIIEGHNGKIWAEAEEGVGTTVHVILPK